MEVVYLISRAKKRSGPVNQAINIIKGLNMIPDVHAVLVTLAPEVENESWLDKFIENNIEVVQLNQSYIYTWRCISKLKKYIRNNCIDIVHSAGFRADYINMKLRDEVFTVSTQRCEPDKLVDKFPRWTRMPFEKYHLHIIKKLDTLVACSVSLQRIFADKYEMSLKCVQNGVNTEFYIHGSAQHKNELRKRMGISENQIVYLMMGRLDYRKNVGLAIEALKKIRNDNIRLLIVGEGPLYEKILESSKYDKRIIVVGPTGYPLDYLQAADILISCSISEGLPNIVLESLSCGLPCILSDIEPHKEILIDSKAGVLTRVNDIDDLVASIKASMNWNIELMSREARSLVEKRFGINILAQNYLNIYNAVRNNHAL